MKPQQTLEERLMQLYDLTPEQAAQLNELAQKAAALHGAGACEAIRAALSECRAIPYEEDKPDLPAHKYERPRLPSQQGYNRTPYDRWRNSLGKRRGRRHRR